MEIWRHHYELVLGISLLNDLRGGGIVFQQDIQKFHENIKVQLILSVLVVVNFVAAVVAFLMWMHRASTDLQHLGVDEQKYSPRAGVIWWFVPIASWWMPYRVLREIWHGSLRYRERTPPMFTIWWWLWCIYVVFSWVLGRG